MESKGPRAAGGTDVTGCLGRGGPWPLRVVCAHRGSLEPGVVPVTFGTVFPGELEEKHAGFLPRSRRPPSVFKMQRPFQRVREPSPKGGAANTRLGPAFWQRLRAGGAPTCVPARLAKTRAGTPPGGGASEPGTRNRPWRLPC